MGTAHVPASELLMTLDNCWPHRCDPSMAFQEQACPSGSCISIALHAHSIVNAYAGAMAAQQIAMGTSTQPASGATSQQQAVASQQLSALQSQPEDKLQMLTGQKIITVGQCEMRPHTE